MRSGAVDPGRTETGAVRAIEARTRKVQSWYLDTTMLRNYWSGGKRAYHHTAPITAVYGLHEALRLVLEEGLEARFERHRRVAEQLQRAVLRIRPEHPVEP